MIPLFFVMLIGGFFVSRAILNRSYDRDISFRIAVNSQKLNELVRAGGGINPAEAIQRILTRMAMNDAMLWGFLGTPAIWGIGLAVIQLRRRD